jgi:hypothetical protein
MWRPALANCGIAFYHWIESMGFVINYRHGCGFARLCKAGAHQLADPEEEQNRAFMRGYFGAKSFIYINKSTQKPRTNARLSWVRSFRFLKRVPKVAQICTVRDYQYQH